MRLGRYFDTLKDIGLKAGKKTLFLPHGPGTVMDLQQTLRAGVMTQAASTSHMNRCT